MNEKSTDTPILCSIDRIIHPRVYKFHKGDETNNINGLRLEDLNKIIKAIKDHKHIISADGNQKTKLANIKSVLGTFTSFPFAFDQYYSISISKEEYVSYAMIFVKGDDEYRKPISDLNDDEIIATLTKLNLHEYTNNMNVKNQKSKYKMQITYFLNQLQSDNVIFMTRKCNILLCNNAAYGEHNYCTSLHKKCCAMEKFIDQYRNVDTMGFYIATQLLNDLVGKYNNPSESNILQPHGSVDTDIPHSSDLFDLYNTHFKYIDIYNAIMEINRNGNSPKVDDIKKRAKNFAKMLTALHVTIILMDGHGRFLLQFLHEVVKQHGAERLKKLRIMLVDIDPEVTKWHKAMYRCDRLESIEINIFESKRISQRTSLLYLNFCGIKSKSDFSNLIQFVQDNENSFMVSFSTQRGALNRDKEFEKENKSKYLQVMHLDSKRSDFHTYIYFNMAVQSYLREVKEKLNTRIVE